MENEIRNMLESSGFIYNEGEWVYNEWTIRIDDQNVKVECFDNSLYYYGSIDKLPDILDDIK